MHRTFKYPLGPNKAQEAVLLSWLLACQQLYNACLQQRIDAWKKARKSLTKYDQHKELTALRKDSEWKAIPIEVERSAIDRLDSAFRAFFRRVKAGEKPGFPRFRSRERYDSFSVGRVSIDGHHVRIPKMGLVRFHKYRELKGRILDVTVRRQVGRWFVCFACDVGEAPPKVSIRSAVGIDLGLNVFAMLSTGEGIANPRFFRKGEELLAARQQTLARAQRGSKNRGKAKLLVQKAHLHVKNQRLEHSRKAACTLFERYDLIAHEDLNIRGMVQGRLGKSISDAGWRGFIGCLQPKAQSAGKWLVPVDPRGTSQRCSSCSQVVRKALSDRVHSCGCGLVLDRDHNAALNIQALGLSAAERQKFLC